MRTRAVKSSYRGYISKKKKKNITKNDTHRAFVICFYCKYCYYMSRVNLYRIIIYNIFMSCKKHISYRVAYLYYTTEFVQIIRRVDNKILISETRVVYGVRLILIYIYYYYIRLYKIILVTTP